MARKSNAINSFRAVSPEPGILGSSRLTEEYTAKQALFDAQSPLIQRFFEAQAGPLAEAVMHNQPQAKFAMPDRVSCLSVETDSPRVLPVPAQFRDQMVGGVLDRITGSDFRSLLRNRLVELEENEQESVATSAALIRYALAVHMVHNLLPSGRSVKYTAAEGDEIPSIPTAPQEELGSAITADTDAIAEEGGLDENRGALQVPFVPAARRFYLPQWVAFDDDCRLLVDSINKAEADITSMQQFLAILHWAVSLAPYFVFDPDYQQKRYGILGQLVNQGRKLANYEVQEMIATIRKRAAANDLNRGLSLSVPYFDDQSLTLATRDFVVIPGGRILFVPAFVVQAAREEEVKVAQDTRLSTSTRRHLLEELQLFESAFNHPTKAHS